MCEPLIAWPDVMSARDRYLREFGMPCIVETIASELGVARETAYKMLTNERYYDENYKPPKVYNPIQRERDVLEFMHAYMLKNEGASPLIREISIGTGIKIENVRTALKRLCGKGKIYQMDGGRSSRIYRIPGKWYPVCKGLFEGLDE